MNLKKPKFWDYKSPNLLAYLLFPLSLIIQALKYLGSRKNKKKFKISKKISTPKEIASQIIFKKNENLGKKIKNIGDKILKKTIKELDILINNELKKT